MSEIPSAMIATREYRQAQKLLAEESQELALVFIPILSKILKPGEVANVVNQLGKSPEVLDKAAAFFEASHDERLRRALELMGSGLGLMLSRFNIVGVRQFKFTEELIEVFGTRPHNSS